LSEPGRGSTFWFDLTLPVVEVAPVERSAAVRVPVGYEGPRRSVLVVDDKDHNRGVLVEMLVPLGFEVITANDGREAVDRSLSERPDVILMDLVMPGKTGLDAIQELRQHSAMKQVIIVAVTASVLESDRTRAMLAGSNAFLSKPVKLKELLAVLEEHLSLTWVYAEQEAFPCAGETIEEHLVPLPPEELATLYELVRVGRLRPLMERLAVLEQGDGRYQPFIRKLQGLARRYEVKQIQVLLQRYLEDAPWK
jgi:CheY-like chemotaxis protein